LTRGWRSFRRVPLNLSRWRPQRRQLQPGRLARTLRRFQTVIQRVLRQPASKIFADSLDAIDLPRWRTTPSWIARGVCGVNMRSQFGEDLRHVWSRCRLAVDCGRRRRVRCLRILKSSCGALDERRESLTKHFPLRSPLSHAVLRATCQRRSSAVEAVRRRFELPQHVRQFDAYAKN